MHLANSTMARRRSITALIILSFLSLTTFAQDNSPYSRYGVGDVVPNRNVISRGMGGIAAGYSDINSINFTNPAALSNLVYTVFDFGAEVDIHTLKSNTKAENYISRNLNISYLQLGFPLYSGKTRKALTAKNIFWAGSFGLRPATRISYKIQEEKRLPGIDSVSTIYEGNGGVNEANISTALKINNFSLGVTGGYAFGNKDFSSRLRFRNDSIPYYYGGIENQSHFGGGFINLGAQYAINFNKNTDSARILTLGIYSNLKQNLKGSKDVFNQTFTYGTDGIPVGIDTVSRELGIKGSVSLPATYGAGFTYATKSFLFGADFSTSNWSSFSYFGQKDNSVQDNYTLRAGAQYSPGATAKANSKYFSYVIYRAGVFYGTDYIKSTTSRKDFGASIGAGFPLTVSGLSVRSGNFVTLNTGLEYNSRGSKNDISFRENIVRVSFGVTMNARWFYKNKFQ